MRLQLVASIVAFAVLSTPFAAAHANMPPPPEADRQVHRIIAGLLGDEPFAAWSAKKELVAFVDTWAQEGTGQGMSVTIAPTNGKAETRVEVFEPGTDMESEGDKAAVMSRARVALAAELGGGDWKALAFTAWPTKPGKDEPVRLPAMELPSPKVTLSVKKQVIYATVPGLKGAKKVLDLKEDGPGDTHVAHVRGAFGDADSAYLVVQVHFEPKDYTEFNAITQSFVVKLPKAPPSK